MANEYLIPKVVKSEYALNHPYGKAKIDTLLIGDELSEYVFWSGNSFSVVLPITVDGILYLSQYKHGAGEVVKEFPAGGIDSGETPSDAAKRELFEETGYVADYIEQVASLWVSAGKSDTRAELFVAMCVDGRNLQWKPEPGVKVHVVTVTEFLGEVLLFSDLSSTTLASLGRDWINRKVNDVNFAMRNILSSWCQ